MSNFQDREAGLNKVKKLNQIAQMKILLDSLPALEKQLQDSAQQDQELLEKLSSPPIRAVRFYEHDIIEHSFFTTLLGICVNDLMDKTALADPIKQSLIEEDVQLPVWLDLDDKENLPAVMFVGHYTLCRSIRAIKAIGRSIDQLLREGAAKNDISLLKLAVKFDPVTISSPHIVSILMQEEIVGKSVMGKNANLLRKEIFNALKNPHKYEKVEHPVLRYIVWVLHEEGLLQEMSDQEQYQFLCEQLGLYPSKSFERPDSFKRLIRRWKEDFRT